MTTNRRAGYLSLHPLSALVKRLGARLWLELELADWVVILVGSRFSSMQPWGGDAGPCLREPIPQKGAASARQAPLFS
jgi:hypothetical protein